ncbi:hypothetical protein TraAM80_05567 [Trypanosoma rangeli]|uniref:Uncharacterized protein n=1 Tax=Trypanosoma rangeli TaxID=5698 RepID=A0A3R7MJQ6_TRYRA|nr:uncharacterized protein TraAM80_05567 [Trypanosoma rangeli]RNF03744.1 hypothetical protein TraAM80_05567 [Trypanosoma rangeli]|eukprot:RNF03744.1 hypothetical protein TraAM80_05567 [Trypanosoma rangeli]
MAMNSVKTQRAQRGTTPVSSLVCVRRNEGDWRSTLKVFVEEVAQLKGETDALKATRAAMEASWQRIVEKVDLLTDENRSSQHTLQSLLEEERQKALAVIKEKKELLAKVKCVEEACASKEKEIHRLAEMLETERIKHSVSVALHEKALEERKAEHQVELSLREKRLEDMQFELQQQLERHENELLAKDALLEEERSWRKRQERSGIEDSSHLLQTKGAAPAFRHSLEPVTDVADISSNKTLMTQAALAVFADDYATRCVPKKTRLEAARQRQRRCNGKRKGDDVTLISLNKLNDLQENFRL